LLETPPASPWTRQILRLLIHPLLKRKEAWLDPMVDDNAKMPARLSTFFTLEAKPSMER
jgi:hypothetical protein